MGGWGGYSKSSGGIFGFQEHFNDCGLVALCVPATSRGVLFRKRES